MTICGGHKGCDRSLSSRTAEESPDSAGQEVRSLRPERCCQNGTDGKCHRKQTVLRKWDKGEKVV